SADKLKALEELTDGAFTIMDATLAFSTTKDILLVEGPSDYKYIRQAVNSLQNTKRSKFDSFEVFIIGCGGSGNVKHMLQSAILPNLPEKQLCIAIFDDDNAGRGCKSAIDTYVSTNRITNIRTLLYPKPSGWSLNDFFVEDFFPLSAYKPSWESRISQAAHFKQINEIKDLKKHIEDNCDRFTDSDYDDFERLLDEIMRMQSTR
ncbi:MAG: hypothetical protein U1C33_01215, partial [Candidatus Cloacimonadaceae bacterium]|nr:hypothetical protein [Candidatus Cloacimonadaceae bacterium]